MGTKTVEKVSMGVGGRLWHFLFPELPPLTSGQHFTIPSLDGIRAVAILLVLIAHCGFQSIVPGGLGVTIFFFLSGYLITTLLRREWRKTKTVNLPYFYIRRCLRILPPNYIVLLISLAFASAMQQSFTTTGLLANFFYFTNYYTVYWGVGSLPGMDVLWSLAVEEHFYFVFPLLYMFIAKLTESRQATILLTICILTLIWRCVLVFGYHCIEWRTYAATDTRLDSILWGCLFAIACNPAFNDRFAVTLANWALAVCGIAILGFCLVYRPDWFRETFRYTLQALAFFPIFAVAIKYWDRFPVSVLNSYIMRLIGVYSYTIYLTHFSIVHYLKPEGQTRQFSLPIVVFAISFIVSAAMYHWVDLPAARLRKKFGV